MSAAVVATPSLRPLPLRSPCLRGLDSRTAGVSVVAPLRVLDGGLRLLAVLCLDAADEPPLWLTLVLVGSVPLPRLCACCIAGLVLMQQRRAWRSLLATPFPALSACIRGVMCPSDNNGTTLICRHDPQAGASGERKRPVQTETNMLHECWWGFGGGSLFASTWPRDLAYDDFYESS